MSNIYITEPATNGKVILTTTVGDIEVELWSKETPLACRNFVQLCMEGYYDDTTFHRLVKGFIVQGGDPTGTGDGGESIYDGPFKTESHSRLSFNRRGLMGMACPEPNCNGSQFFFTLGEALELNGKHTLFGRVVGNTLFNMLRLSEVDVVNGDQPIRLHRILKTTVILNPYDDIVPRQIKPKKKTESNEKVQPTVKATKNFCLLSFGSEAEEEEEISSKAEEKFRSRGKSAHDLVSDESLSKETVKITEEDAEITAKASAILEAEAEARRRRRELASRFETEEELRQKQKRMEELRAEADAVRRDIARTMRSAKERAAAAEATRQAAETRAQREEEELRRAEAWEAEQREKAAAGLIKATAQPMVENFDDEVASYRLRAKKNKERKDREGQTMNRLSRFQSRLLSALKKSKNEGADNDNGDSDEGKTQPADPTAWLCCKLISEEPTPARRVMDPSLEDPDRHDLYDPRNPLNLRKRGAFSDDSGGDGRRHHKRSRK
ncbi:peptidyl prolyl cis trans isomerase CWC27 [Echinococcus multilocularis]|uniref:Spliceosome-associated protein CWC27 homolog n=1 Tax=Echinococcus multilocularis TaxID=6211 RepID=A0A068Y7X5_ECHMU|nr:peptidyl prolyl cis trans isomerase CWC27 [Echinococcus multilocularis]